MQSLPDGIEIPNHVGICSDPARADYNPATCFETLRYNAINTAEVGGDGGRLRAECMTLCFIHCPLS